MNNSTMGPKISVIIPVYNAGAYLVDCIRSLVNQTLKDCEFIFINDGSTDTSKQIIEEFQKQDSRIILVNQENAGISGARNKGVEISKGHYIGFLDNDDFVKEDMFETLYNTAIEFNLDIVVSKTLLGRDEKYIVKETAFAVNQIYDKEFITDEIIPNLLRVEDLFAVWNKIYHRDLILSNKVRFPKRGIIEEDNIFNIQAFNNASSVLFLDYAGYYYRDVVTSESRLTIERDYFEKALQKYHFDYKKEYDLSVSYSEMEKLKSVRFIQRVVYLIYKCAVDPIPFKKKYTYIKQMVFHPEVYKLSIEFSKEILESRGKYEALVLKIIKNRSEIWLYILIITIQLLYHPKISEFIRLLNNPNYKSKEAK